MYSLYCEMVFKKNLLTVASNYVKKVPITYPLKLARCGLVYSAYEWTIEKCVSNSRYGLLFYFHPENIRIFFAISDKEIDLNLIR